MPLTRSLSLRSKFQQHAFNMLIISLVLFAAVILFAQIEFPKWGSESFSVLEMALWCALLISIIATVKRLTSLQHNSSLRRWWMLAAMALTAMIITQSADWYVDDELHANIWQFFDLDYLVNTLLAISLAAGLIWVMRLPGQNLWLKRGLVATVIFQIMAILTELTESGKALGAFRNSAQVCLSTEFAELLCIEFYLVSLVLSSDRKERQIAAQTRRLVKPLRGAFVGANARMIYESCNLFRAAKYPPVKILFYPGFKQVGFLAIMGYLLVMPGRIVKLATGKSLFTQCMDLLNLWFRQGVDPQSYYAQQLYLPGRMQDAPHYLTRYETKNGLLTALNNMLPQHYVVNEMKDKEKFSEICVRNTIPTPAILAVVQAGQVSMRGERDDFRRDLFCKRKADKGAKGTLNFTWLGDDRYQTPEGEVLTFDDIMQKLVIISQEHDMLVQPWLKNHPDIADFAASSLLAIRVATWINEDGDPEVTLAMLRVLSKLEPGWPNIPDKEYGTPIDLETGMLGPMAGDNVMNCTLRYDRQLITGAPITGRVLKQWPEICEVALKAHRCFPNRLLVGWDIALTEQGPVVLEGNTNLDIMFLQRVQNKPIGRSRFGELMNYHMRQFYWRYLNEENYKAL